MTARCARRRQHRGRLVVASALLILASCRPAAREDAPTAQASAGPRPADHAVLGPGDTVQGASIYDLDVALTDQDGTAVKLDVFRGRPVLVSMFYSSCPHACPTLIRNVQRVERALDPAVRDQIRVLLVSFDPERDTPEALRGVVARHRLDTARWKLTTTTEAQVRDVAAVLGITYRRADGTFNHSSVIAVLDRDGHIDQRSDGLADATADVAARLTALVPAR